MTTFNMLTGAMDYHLILCRPPQSNFLRYGPGHSHVPEISNSCLVIIHFAILVQIHAGFQERGAGANKEEGYTMRSQTLDGKKLNFLPQDRSNFLLIS